MKILIIRTDNLGDLLCTTPAIRALKKSNPCFDIFVLCNSYNQAVIQENSDINKIYAYTKAKHKNNKQSLLSIYFKKLKLFYNLRREKFDYAIIASTFPNKKGWIFARVANPKKIVGYADKNIKYRKQDIPIKSPPHRKKSHEVENVYELFKIFNVPAEIPNMVLCHNNRDNSGSKKSSREIALHISSRKTSQRLHPAQITELIGHICKNYNFTLKVFWMPGDELSFSTHPGDSKKILSLKDKVRSDSVIFCSTNSVHELIEQLSNCEVFIGSDGGAMHIAAALNIPVFCFFGDSNPLQWRPWGVDYDLLQDESLSVSKLDIKTITNRFDKFLSKIYP